MVADEKAQQAEEHRFFEMKIRPILATHCYECHAADVQEAKLRLDSWAAIEKGGKGGPILVAGQPELSVVVAAISHKNPELKMPPEKRLSDGEIADLTTWIKRGAPHPDRAAGRPRPTSRIDLEAGRKFWSFQPITKRPPPESGKDNGWATSPIDGFIFAELAAAELKPAGPADRATLLRRVTFDLLGLPPTPSEVEAFEQEMFPDDFERVVDRLLASPHYGERWGRHWLDVARYADSNGLDENVAFGNAWRYRDYVISALNRDKPYDQFLLEQLAGDLLPGSGDFANRKERLIATGFLALGPKVLAEVDETKMEMDILDEQIDTFGRSILGLTFGCARCHDHKFDPIRAEDYYALAGIFKSTRSMEHFKKIARWWENPIATPEEQARKSEHDQQVANLKQVVESIVKTNKEVLVASKPELLNEKNVEAHFPAEAQAELKQRRDELAALEKSAPVLPIAMGLSESTAANVPIHLRGSHLTLGPAPPRGFPAVLVTSQPAVPPDRSGRLELAQWLIREDHPLTARVMANRLWRWHFGQGLVGTTDNFGRLGEMPTHPELLDWLAREFMDRGWSLKEMHRQILLTSTWQMSSDFNSLAAAKDSENRRYWRMPIRRLEAEELRDALLATSGLLDKRMGGSLLHVGNREFLFDHTSKDNTKYDSMRRTVYLPVIRNNLYDVLQLFDATDATVLDGNRASTVVAPQSLFFMNGEIVERASQSLASDVLSEPALSSQVRIQRLYRLAFGRAATEDERSRCLSYLSQLTGGKQQGEQSAWASLCHALLSGNEFIYLR